ncbi:uncharacterized protein LOC125673265 isoform X5 [Ostrea edulis]|uniref:uncharacterized protein LOC125673265 isoform X5 n=1 Tax=Ostrea edulis TaxID=37623 RepID=UPI0024AF3063|nr:uncharacterized protein LOC125673265 isoform X5 [Ostrea edulis]
MDKIWQSYRSDLNFGFSSGFALCIDTSNSSVTIINDIEGYVPSTSIRIGFLYFDMSSLYNILSVGKCSEYNHGAKRIQSSGMKICSNFTPPCPTVYNSSDAYMYQGCYDFSRTVQGNSEMTITFPPVPPTNQASGLETGIILVSIGLAVVVFVVGFAGIIRLYKKNRYNHSDECCENLNRNKHSCTNEESFPKGALL